MPVLQPGEGLDPGGGSTGPYFYLMLNNFGQDLYWDAANEQPHASAFTISMYYNYVLNRRIEYFIDFSEPVPSWLNISGSSVSGGQILTTGAMQKSISVNITDISALPNGTYNAQISFYAYAKYNNVESMYDAATYFVTLTINNNASASIKAEFNQYNVFFNRQTGILSGDTTVNILNNTTPIDLKFSAQYFQTKTAVTTVFDLDEVNMANDAGLPTQGSVAITGGLFKLGDVQIANVNINLILAQNAEIFTDKNLISLSIIKSNSQTASDSFYLTNPENKDFTIASPGWLNLSVSSGNTSTYVTVTTIPPSGLSGGTHTGEIVVSYDNKTVVIQVVLTVTSFINFNVDADNKFCMDIPKINFNRMNAGARFVRITLNAVYNLMGVETIKENLYFVPYVNDKAEFNIGEKVQKQFPRYKGDYFGFSSELELMKNAVVSFKAEELDSSYNILLSEVQSDNRLFPGSKPDGYPLLSDFLFRKKNDKAIFFNSRIEDDKIIVEKIDDTKDIVTLQYGSKEVIYYQYPKYNKILHLHFESENLSPEWFSLTGEYKISSDYSHIYAKSIFKSQNEKYDFSKVKMLTINSGFFMKEELGLLEKLIESKLAFIKIENKIYRCFSTLQKFVLNDSNEELVNKDLEFLIVE
jgi:hypothetical protein